MLATRHFATLISLSMPAYLTLQSKRGKMHLVTLLLEIIHQGGGRFLREGNDSLWRGVKRRTAREKISACSSRSFDSSLPTTRSDSPSDANQDEHLEEEVVLEPRPCWRTIVYETLERSNETKKKSKKQTTESIGQVGRTSIRAPRYEKLVDKY